MKDFRFYADYGSAKAKRKGGDAPNVIAVILSSREYYVRQGRGEWESIAATFHHANSDTSACSVSDGYLRESCKRIPENEARRLHPRLFQRLDAKD